MWLVLLLLPSLASADQLTVEKGTLVYSLDHKLHKTRATSRAVEGRARIAEGRAQVVVTASVASFDSGNVNRDAHMKEAVEAARFPTVELKAIGELAPPAEFPSTSEVKLRAQVTLHGVPQVVELPVRLEWQSASRVRAKASFTVSLEKFGIERPALMFVKVADALRVEADVTFSR